jgi:Domain of unknown function (DUF4460)
VTETYVTLKTKTQSCSSTSLSTDIMLCKLLRNGVKLTSRALAHNVDANVTKVPTLNYSSVNNAKSRRSRSNSTSTVKGPETIPDFHELLRQLYRKSHPDLLRASHPQFAEVNDSSMQLLNGILSTIKKYNEYPAQIVKTIPFHIRDGEVIKIAHLKIQTAGGDCRRSLSTSFQNFFLDVGITNKETGGSFSWGKDYFPTSGSVNTEESDKK